VANQITMTLVGADKIQKKLLELTERAKDPGKALKLVANAMRRDVLDHFDEERGSDGKWEKLSPATIAWKAAHGHSRPLQNTGNLRLSVMPESGQDFAKVVAGGVKAPYAIYQNYGGDVPGRPPAREFMWLSAKAAKGIFMLMRGWIMGGL